MNSKNALILFIIFLIFSFAVCIIPEITQYDIECIKYVQSGLSDINSQIPIMAGGIIFYAMTFLPILIGCTYFFLNKMYKNIFLFGAVPFLAYFINSIIKAIVQRPRPPIELQIEEHMSSSSYVSRHTFVTACVFSIFIYFVCKYCKNKLLKLILVIMSAVWITFEGFSRVWLGVHNPTDVIGALILACIFFIVYVRLIEKLETND